LWDNGHTLWSKVSRICIFLCISAASDQRRRAKYEQSITSGFALELPSTHALIAHTRGSIRYRPRLTKSIDLSQSIWQKKRSIDFAESFYRVHRNDEKKIVTGCKGQDSCAILKIAIVSSLITHNPHNCVIYWFLYIKFMLLLYCIALIFECIDCIWMTVFLNVYWCILKYCNTRRFSQLCRKYLLSVYKIARANYKASTRSWI